MVKIRKLGKEWMRSNFEQEGYRRTRFDRAHPYESVSCHTLQYDYLIPIKVLGAVLELFPCPLSDHFEIIRPVISGQRV